MAPDSGGGMMCARSSFFAPPCAWVGVGFTPPAASITATTTATHATLRITRLMDASCPACEARAFARPCQAAAVALRSARRDRSPPRHPLDAERRDDGPHDRGHGRHARRRLPALRDDVDVRDLRPALHPVLLGGGDRRVLAGVADVHRRGHRDPARHALRRAHHHRAAAARGAARGQHRPRRAARRLRGPPRVLRLAGQRAELAVLLPGPRREPPLALSLVGGGRPAHDALQRRRRRRRLAREGLMLVATVVVTFLALTVVSLPIVFALGFAGFTGLLVGNFSLQKLPSALVAGSQSWVLLAIPTFIFAGNLMERCGMSYALVDLARALIGWVRGGLGMSVVLAEYFFSGISGSTIADVSAIGAMLTPPMLRAGYKPEHAASLVASATAMGILVPPAIFMIVLGQIMDTSVVAIFLGGFIPAAVTAACLMVVIFVQAHRLGWPKDERPTWANLSEAGRASLVPLVVPVVIVLGFFFGVFTATEAGALVAAYAVAAALLYYRNVSLREMWTLLHETALL